MCSFDGYFLNDLEKITHYVRTDHFREILTTQRLYLSRQDKQSDKKDGSHSPARGVHIFDSQLLGNQAERLADSYRFSAELMRKRTYLHSWTRRAEECREMWTLYGHNGHDVCISSSIGRLKSSLGIGSFPRNIQTSDGVLSLEVIGANYESNSEPSQMWPSSLVALRKEKTEFSIEREVRVLGTLVGHDSQEGLNHHIVPVEPSILIEELYFGSQMPEHCIAALQAEIEKATSHIVTRRSKFHF